MLKRVPVSQVELGMFIHKLEGSWFKHPFWKSRFLLTDRENLNDLRCSDVASVLIDTSKGKDIAAPANDMGAEAAPASRPVSSPSPRRAERPRAIARIAALKSRNSVNLQSTRPVTIAQESAAAQIVAGKAQKAVSQAFLDARLGKTLNIGKIEPVVRDIHRSVQRNPQAFSGLMRCKLNNEFVYRHALSVSALMVSLARKLRLDEKETREAGLAGLFLDIGTNYLAKELGGPNGDYRNADPDVWMQHVRLSEAALLEAGSISPTVLAACLQHHERIDGKGFPQGLKGGQIELIARMAAICDTFDFLLIDGGVNGSPLDPAAAIVRMLEMEGAFDTEVLDSFIESVGIYPIGAFVELRSGKLAMVVDIDREAIDKPVVSTFYSLATNERTRPTRIELARCYGRDAIVGPADLTGLVLPEPAQLRELIYLQAHKLKR